MISVLKSFFVLCVLSYSMHSIAMVDDDDCDPLSISNALSSLHLNPTIKNNGNFFAGILSKFGLDISNDMLTQHPVLMNKPNAAIDMKTIEWFISSYAKFDITDKTSASKIFFTPFLTIENKFGADSMIRTAIGRSFPYLLYIPAFLSLEQFNSMKSTYKENDYQLSTNYFVLFYKLNRDIAYDMAKALYHKIFHYNNYILPNDLKKIQKNKKLVVQGHGKPGVEYISDSNVKLHYSEVVEIIINSQIPSHINLELPHCFGTCGQSVGDGERLDKTENEILEIFKNKKMSQFFGPIENSYSYKFASLIYDRWPGYENNIISYYGSVGFLESSAWVRDVNDPKKLTQYTVPFVSWLDKNGKAIKLDRDEFRYIHKKHNLQLSAETEHR